MLSRRRCCCGRTPVTCLFCTPCKVPTKNLGYSYTGVSPLSPASDSGVLAYNSGTSDWLSASFAGGYTVDMQCVGNTVTPTILLAGVSQATFGAPSSTTCNPLSLVYTVPNPSDAYTAGFRTLTISDPGPPTSCPEPCSCSNCNACGGIAILPGGTVTDKNGTHSLTGVTTDNITVTGLPSWFGGGGACGACHIGTGDFQYSLSYGCNFDGTISVSLTAPSTQGCQECGVPPDNCGFTPSSTTVTKFVTPTCSGGTLTFSANFSIDFSGSCDNAIESIVDDASFSIPYTIDPMCQAFLVVGCNGLGTGLGGSTVSVYDRAGGTLLFSGTTNSGGGIPKVYFDNVANPVWITVTPADSRMQSHAASHTLTCDGTTTITLSPDSNYVCVSGCAVPVAKTLFTTHPTFGALTLVYNASGTLGAGWYSTVNYSYTACRCCPAKTVSVTCFLSTSLQFSDHWKSN